MIDLVVTQVNGKYLARGGPDTAIFDGIGNNADEAVGAWFRNNRESVGFFVSFVEDGKFMSSTVFGGSRTKDQLGPNELKAFNETIGFGD